MKTCDSAPYTVANTDCNLRVEACELSAGRAVTAAPWARLVGTVRLRAVGDLAFAFPPHVPSSPALSLVLWTTDSLTGDDTRFPFPMVPGTPG